MPSRLGRNLHLCFTKIKRPTDADSSLTPLTTEDHGRRLPNSSNTPTPTSILFKNFNSLYDHTFDSTSKSLSHSSDISSTESDTQTTTPDFSTIFASQRFFFSSPGRSNSIIKSTSSSSQDKILESDPLVGGGIAIPTYSPDPYKDFRRSMQEMVEARDLIDVRANWDYLHELLLCYLALNPKSTHKVIVRAFADLLVSLMPSQAQGGGQESDISGSGCNILRRCM